MNVQSMLFADSGGRNSLAGAAILLTLLGMVPAGTFADQRTSATTTNSAAEVSLSGLDLSTPAGMRLARDRLHAMAERLCAARAGHELSAQPALGACVDSTVANALRPIDALRGAHQTALNSVTLGANVSLADLDLSTLEGARIARERLDSMARHLCAELARQQDLSYQPNYAACVQDSLAGALTQADALAADRATRTARRSAR